MGFVLHRANGILREAKLGTEQAIRMTRAVAALVYQEEGKTRALLRELGAD
jgi:hypothetical protein